MIHDALTHQGTMILGHPVPGVSTEGGAANWVPILGGVNNIDKILRIVPKWENSVSKLQKCSQNGTIPRN